MCQWQRYERRVVVGSVAVGRGRAIWSEDIWPYWRAREQAYTTDRNQECQECKMSWGYWHWHSKAEWFGIAMKPKQSYPEQVGCGSLGSKRTDLTLDVPVPGEWERRCTPSRLPYLKSSSCSRPRGLLEMICDCRGVFPWVGNKGGALAINELANLPSAIK